MVALRVFGAQHKENVKKETFLILVVYIHQFILSKKLRTDIFNVYQSLIGSNFLLHELEWPCHRLDYDLM